MCGGHVNKIVSKTQGRFAPRRITGHQEMQLLHNTELAIYAACQNDRLNNRLLLRDTLRTKTCRDQVDILKAK